LIINAIKLLNIPRIVQEKFIKKLGKIPSDILNPLRSDCKTPNGILGFVNFNEESPNLIRAVFHA
jgi:hypothetical protein